MQITLYQAAETVRHLLEQIDPETGEMPDGFDQARAIVATKAQAVAAFILSNNAEAEMVEAHAKALLERVKTARRRSDWLKTYLTSHMQGCGITDIKSDDGLFKASLSIGRDESVEIWDEKQLPGDYLVEKTTVSPDKKLIAKAIKDGFEVPGAKLVKKDRLTLK